MAEAKQIYKSDALTRYRVTVGDKAYIATTYPDSHHITMETENGKLISSLRGRKILGIIREAIADV